MRKQFPLLLLCIFFFGQSYAQNSDFVVQVAAFDQSVSLDYFKGLTGVYHVEDHNNIHKYYIAGFADENAATASAKNAKGLGYNARVIDMDKVRNTCSLSCGMATDSTKIQSIFFDFDKYNLRRASNVQLDRLFKIMIANSDYKVELSAHTDAKGSLGYNNTLSMNRAKAAQNYLINEGLASTRIRISTFGEDAPIAKNKLNGKDTPAGRQYNRRVELIVHNISGAVEPVVERIKVPGNLQQ
ncbi:MAG: outer membrane protein OmpA-like peptidoglycan-associated protein [Polaribacter sp.]|jgi:outer membrane protein OmpA-like peptidoglycan-associated protein